MAAATSAESSAAKPAAETSQKDNNSNNNNAEEEDQEDVEPAQEWDEGGPSHCGYHATVHDTLMSVGESVHSVVGDPPETVDSGMKQVGNWFQEASYAVRDFMRGEKVIVADEEVNELSKTEDAANADATTSEEKKTGDATAQPTSTSAK